MDQVFLSYASQDRERARRSPRRCECDGGQCFGEVTPPLGFRRLQVARIVGWPDAHDVSEFEQLTRSIAALLGEDLSHAPAASAQAETIGPNARESQGRTGGNRKVAATLTLVPFVAGGLALSVWSEMYNSDVGFIAGLPVLIVGALLAAFAWRRAE